MIVLKAHEKFGQSAKRCAAALHFLSSKILDDTSAESDTPESQSHYQTGQDILEVGNFSDDMADFTQFGTQDADFDMNNLAWLNDMHATWELLNHG